MTDGVSNTAQETIKIKIWDQAGISCNHGSDELAALKVGYEDQYDQILRFRINWEDAMRSLDEFKKWCDSVRSELTNPDFQPTYRQMREALEMIGIRVIVFREDHHPRFIVEVSPPDIMSKFRVIVKGKKDRIESKSL